MYGPAQRIACKYLILAIKRRPLLYYNFRVGIDNVTENIHTAKFDLFYILIHCGAHSNDHYRNIVLFVYN
jgi:hypothetical protein